MNKGRLEAFSDGVIAIIITIVVLAIEPPEKYDLHALISIQPLILMHGVTFFIIGVYWLNHHHLFEKINRVNGRIIWANFIYLFFVSLCPVTTGWVGKSHFAPIPMRWYAVIYLLITLSFIFPGSPPMVNKERQDHSRRFPHHNFFPPDLLPESPAQRSQAPGSPFP